MLSRLAYLAQNEQIMHSLKTAFACFIGFILAHYIHFQAMQWVIITTLVVMCAQINVGSMMQKSYLRFLGTLAGSTIAILTLKIFNDNALIHMGVVLMAAILFSFIATSDKSYSESGTLGAVTVTIILLTPNVSIQSGIERFIEISLGILIAALVSQFIFPVHAASHLRRNQAATIKKLKTFYLNLFSSTPTLENIDAMRNLDEEIVKSLIAQRKLAGEAKREKFGRVFNIDHFQQSLWCEKEIIRSIIFMFYAYQKSARFEIILTHQKLLDNFHQTTCNVLQLISDSIDSKKPPENIIFPDIQLFKTVFVEEASLNDEEKIPVTALVFCAETLVERLKKMVGLLTQTV